MVFKGSETRTAEDSAYAIDGMGGHLDAFTTMRSRLGADHEWTQDTQARLIELYEAWGQPAKADAHRALPAVDSTSTSE